MELRKLSKEKSTSKIIKRRSKSEIEGRTFSCEQCQKKYLSYPALYTHKKLKHEKNNEQNRKKGRPKKNQNEDIIEKNKYNPVNITFFAKEERTGKTSYNEINSCIDDVFIELYVEDEIALKKYNSLEEHPFLNKFKNDNHDIYKNAINMHETTDKVFIDYLNKMSAFCNKKYFVKLIKFLTLFRECINNINDNNDLEGNKEYTEINDAEKIPYFSNKFLNFLFPEGIEKNFEFTKEESIDLIQNICYWMYDNNFTSSYIILKNIR